MDEGSSATVSIIPDEGYTVKSLKVNGTDYTYSISNNQYTIYNINQDTKIEISFDSIPPETYQLTIKATGNGYASYSDLFIRNTSKVFILNEGAFASISIIPDNGSQIKCVKVNGVDHTLYVTDNQYTVVEIKQNTSIEIEFEAISPTTYTLSIKATGEGYASYNGTTIRNTTKTFTVIEGANAAISFSPNSGYRIKSVKKNGSAVSYTGNQYTVSNISSNTSVEVEFEEIPSTTYTLSIATAGGGYALYSGTNIRNTTKTFTVIEGTNSTITFSPDNGYRIKSVKKNGSVVGYANNQYTVSNISANTTVSIVFEAIPTYTLTINVLGNGYATYGGYNISNGYRSYTLNEGTSATINLYPSEGYRIKSLKVNNVDQTSSVTNNKYTVSNITAHTTVTVEFETIPVTTYSLSIKATGNGSAIFNSVSVKNSTKSFSVSKGASAVITLSPDNGYRIKSLKINSLDRTSVITNNQYTISNISANTTVEVEFEATPPAAYNLYVKATGNGYAWYNGTSIKNTTKTFSVNEGASATIVFSPESGYRIKCITVNDVDKTSEIADSRYTINSMTSSAAVEVEFEVELTAFNVEGINYRVVSNQDKTIKMASGNYGKVLKVPAMVSFQNSTWKVVGTETDALENNQQVTAIIWNPETAFTASVKNPNLLLYVKAENYAPTAITNVVVNGKANNIVLHETDSGNNFYCPQAFNANKISFTHRYSMNTGIGEARGWETIALPFDVQKVTHESKGEIIPFSQWESGYSQKPFWLKTWGDGGWVDASSIKANTPYIISMPNNEAYHDDYRISGVVTFLAENATVESSSNLHVAMHGGKQFVPTFENVGAEKGVYSLNVSNDNETDNGGAVEGSRFILNLRKLHPFEAYMTVQTRGNDFFDISDDMGVTTQEEQLTLSVYNLKGQMMKTTEGMTMEEIRKRLPKGIYIVNGKKMMIK